MSSRSKTGASWTRSCAGMATTIPASRLHRRDGFLWRTRAAIPSRCGLLRLLLPHRRAMTHNKNEDEYFARRDADLLRQQRAAAQQAAADGERKKHYMKCPKCGYDLITHDWDGIQIDQCTHCHGVWFDAREAEALMKTSAPNILGRVFRAVAKGVTRK